MKHLEEERKREREMLLEIVPSGLERYNKCKIFSKEEMNKMEKEKIGHEMIGKIEIDEDERAILDLNPKFAIMKRLKTIEMEEDKELCLAKLRYEAHKIDNLRRETEKEDTDYGYIS